MNIEKFETEIEKAENEYQTALDEERVRHEIAVESIENDFESRLVELWDKLDVSSIKNLHEDVRDLYESIDNSLNCEDQFLSYFAEHTPYRLSNDMMISHDGIEVGNTFDYDCLGGMSVESFVRHGNFHSQSLRYIRSEFGEKEYVKASFLMNSMNEVYDHIDGYGRHARLISDDRLEEYIDSTDVHIVVTPYELKLVTRGGKIIDIDFGSKDVSEIPLLHILKTEIINTVQEYKDELIKIQDEMEELDDRFESLYNSENMLEIESGDMTI